MKDFLKKIGRGICAIGLIFYWIYWHFIVKRPSGYKFEYESEKRIVSFIFGIIFIAFVCIFIGLIIVNI